MSISDPSLAESWRGKKTIPGVGAALGDLLGHLWPDHYTYVFVEVVCGEPGQDSTPLARSHPYLARQEETLATVYNRN